ncbi:MAG: hypothetical protein ACLP9L_33990 [Thermoguttaceae bacterium]
MSTTTEPTLETTIQITPVPGRGRRRVRVAIMHGDTAVHLDTIEIDNARSRAGFIEQAEERAGSLGITLNRVRIENRLLEDAMQAQPAAAADTCEPPNSGEVLDAFGIDVLGEMDDQSSVCWVPETGKRWRVKSPANWRVEEMLQAMGRRALNGLWREPGQPPSGRYRPEALREAVAIAAATAPRLTASRFVGQGVWRHDSRILIVNGGQACLYDGKGFEAVGHPRLGNKIIDFHADAAWIDGLEQQVQAMTAEVAVGALQRLQGVLGNWNWTHAADAEVVAALIPATFIQACWTWRPLVSIIGASDAGKSTLLGQVIVPVLGDWTIAADRSTEAGLRQRIGCNAAPVVIDEFDLYKQRQQVLELFRTSSRGGEILRGTADQTGISYGVRHIAWFAAIESGDVWGQDRNRFIRLELLPPQNRGDLVLPGSRQLGELGRQLTVAAIWAAPRAVELAEAIRNTIVPNIHGRLVESYAVPAAMHAVLTHGRDVSRDVAVETLRHMIGGRAVLAIQGERDEVQLLRDILSSTVRVPEAAAGIGSGTIYVERTVGQILSTAMARNGRPPLAPPSSTALDIVAAHGLRIVQRRDNTQRLFVSDDVVRRQLLRDTRWHNSRIDQILSRLAGAEREQQRLAGPVRYRGLSYPWPDCLEEIGDRDNE